MKSTKEKHFKMGVIQRLATTLQNYASSEFGEYFYSDEYLEGLAKQRLSNETKLRKSIQATIVSAFGIALFQQISGNITAWGLSLPLPSLTVYFLCLVSSASMLALTINFIDIIIIDRFIHVLGSRRGIYQYSLFTLKYGASNLWANAFAPTYLGLRSNMLQKVLFSLFGVTLLLAAFSLYIFPAIILIYKFTETPLNQLPTFAIFMIATSGLIIASTFALGASFLIRFKFSEAKLPEPFSPFVLPNAKQMGDPRAFQISARKTQRQ